MTPWGSSSSSPAMHRSRPWILAMPSPTLSTVPTSATSMSAEKPPSCSRRILVISSARISMPRPSLVFPLARPARRDGAGEPPPQGGEPRAHAFRRTSGRRCGPGARPRGPARPAPAARPKRPPPRRAAPSARFCSSGRGTAETTSAETTPRAAFASPAYASTTSGRRAIRSRAARRSRSRRRSSVAPARSASAARTRCFCSAPTPGCRSAAPSSGWPARTGRERPELVAEREDGLGAPGPGHVEEGPGVAPGEGPGRAHVRVSPARNTAAHARLGVALCLTSMVRVAGAPEEPLRLDESGAGYHGPEEGVKDGAAALRPARSTAWGREGGPGRCAGRRADPRAARPRWRAGTSSRRPPEVWGS